MANAKKLTLTSPIVRADGTYLKIMTSTINHATGKVEGTYCLCASDDSVVGSGRYEYDMPAPNLATVENEILTQADIADALPDGTVGDI